VKPSGDRLYEGESDEAQKVERPSCVRFENWSMEFLVLASLRSRPPEAQGNRLHAASLERSPSNDDVESRRSQGCSLAAAAVEEAGIGVCFGRRFASCGDTSLAHVTMGEREFGQHSETCLWGTEASKQLTTVGLRVA
jgi:hypothetical protein